MFSSERKNLFSLGRSHENLAQEKSLNPIICSITPRGQTLPEAVNKTKHVFNLERKHVFSLGRSYEEKLALSSIQFRITPSGILLKYRPYTNPILAHL